MTLSESLDIKVSTISSSIGNCDRNWIHISYTSIQVWDIRHYIIDRILYPAPSHLENVSQMSIPDYMRRIAEINVVTVAL
jgi:hypothetical protein